MKPRTIRSKHFDGTEQLSLEDWKKLRVADLGSAADTLVPGWRGEVTAMVGLRLSDDNNSIEESIFLLQGQLLKNKKSHQADKFFNIPSNVKLILVGVNCGIFDFSNGLSSNLVDSSSLTYHFEDEEGRLSDARVKELGIEGFTVRMCALPSTAFWVALTLVLYPLPKAQLVEKHVWADSPEFPGLSCFKGEVPLNPPVDVLLKKAVGLPIVPAVLPGAAFSLVAPSIPTRAVVVAVAKTLRATSVPEIVSSKSLLLQRWDRISTVGDSALQSTTPEKLWPLPSDPLPASASSG